MKIICIGRNYYQHIDELANKVPNEPLFFLKPETAIQPKNHPFFIPDFSNNIHYEVELVIKINKTGKNIEEKFFHFFLIDFKRDCLKTFLLYKISFSGVKNCSKLRD